MEETLPQTQSQTPQPKLNKEGEKYKFEDGTRLYHSEEKAMNALKGFRKFQAKREETSQLIYKKSYEEVTKEMTPEEKKDYDKSLSGKYY